MNIGVIAIGKMKSGPERELFERYALRARNSGKQLGLSGFNVIEIIESKAKTALLRKSEEAKAIKANIAKNSIIIALDEKGKSITSLKFANQLASWRDEGHKNLSFIIGGADGLDATLLNSANIKLAFSLLTWPHQLVRIMLMEQFYRATTILSNHPYHREG